MITLALGARIAQDNFISMKGKGLNSPRSTLRSTNANMLVLPFPTTLREPIESETDGSTLALQNRNIYERP